MKKLYLLIAASFLLTACSTTDGNNEVLNSSEFMSVEIPSSMESSKSVESVESSSNIIEEDATDESLEVFGNSKLTKIGQWKKDEYFGKVTLEKMATINESYEIASNVNAIIDEIKLLKIEELSDKFKRESELFGFQGQDTLYILQVTPIFENNNDHELYAASFNRLIDSQDFQRDTNLNAIYTNDLAANAKTDRNTSLFVLPNNEITNFTIMANELSNDGYRMDVTPIELSF